MKQTLSPTLTANGPTLSGPARDLSRRRGALVIALISCGLWVILVRLALEFY